AGAVRVWARRPAVQAVRHHPVRMPPGPAQQRCLPALPELRSAGSVRRVALCHSADFLICSKSLQWRCRHFGTECLNIIMPIIGLTLRDTTMRLLRHITALFAGMLLAGSVIDRKSTRLNSSHVKISYAVFCFKKNN